MMGNVVRLERLVEPAKQRRHAKSQKTTAEIVIFPGVRYERWDDAVATACPRRAGNARDFIEL
ncbi:MAG: hypothetical protein KDJ36_05580 [Hyphomicrobiaceae bacterium]|nr:hypothetical protein [Hyphomicrobiaceae bacterium]